MAKYGMWKCGKLVTALQVTAAAEVKQRQARNGAEKKCKAGQTSFSVAQWTGEKDRTSFIVIPFLIHDEYSTLSI